MMEVIKWREKTMLIWKILLQVNFYERIIIKKKNKNFTLPWDIMVRLVQSFFYLERRISFTNVRYSQGIHFSKCWILTNFSMFSNVSGLTRLCNSKRCTHKIQLYKPSLIEFYFSCQALSLILNFDCGITFCEWFSVQNNFKFTMILE